MEVTKEIDMGVAQDIKKSTRREIMAFPLLRDYR